MTKIIKLHRGLTINLKGVARKEKTGMKTGSVYALQPDDFEGVKPKVVVKEGDKVKAGDALFVNKAYPEVKFASPVSGTVKLIERGERRKVLSVQVEADKEQQYVDFGKKDASKLTGAEVKQSLLEAGLFGYINQLPYAISTNPTTEPKAIFVSALRDMPLAGDFEYEVQGQEEDFKTGLVALSKIAKVYVGVGKDSQMLTKSPFKGDLEGLECVVFSGKCPAGNVGVQVNHIDPVNKGEVVWTVDPTAVLFFGRLFNTGKVNLIRTLALAGSEVKNPCYFDALVGSRVNLNDNVNVNRNIRIIAGNPLTGKPQTSAVVGAHQSEITVIPEGDDADEILGWIMPRLKQFSVNRSYFSWLFPKKDGYTLDARVKGGERHMIMSGEYDKVLPMDIYGEYLIKAIIAQDIDKMEALGIYEVSPEDFALAEFVDSSKLELQKIVREGLDMLRKENE